MHYYQKNDEGVIVAVCDWEQAGFEYTDEEIVQTYDGQFAFKKDIQNDEYEAAKSEYERKANMLAEIMELKQKLADTDYQAIKYAEGEISLYEYEPIKAERRYWRSRINELELLLEQ